MRDVIFIRCSDQTMNGIFIPTSEGNHFEEHTADVWLVGEGDRPETLLPSMANGLYRAISSKYRLDRRIDHSFEINAASLDVLLVEFMSELLFVMEGEGIIFTDMILDLHTTEKGHCLKVNGIGSNFQIDPEAALMEVKAISYHGAYLRLKGSSWEGRVLLDI